MRPGKKHCAVVEQKMVYAEFQPVTWMSPLDLNLSVSVFFGMIQHLVSVHFVVKRFYSQPEKVLAAIRYQRLPWKVVAPFCESGYGCSARV